MAITSRLLGLLHECRCNFGVFPKICRLEAANSMALKGYLGEHSDRTNIKGLMDIASRFNEELVSPRQARKITNPTMRLLTKAPEVEK